MLSTKLNLLTAHTLKHISFSTSLKLSHSHALEHEPSPLPDHPQHLDFNERTDSLLKLNTPFKFDELIVCKTVERNIGNKKKQKVRVKLIQLKPGEILRTRLIEIFHQHIVDKSLHEHANDVSFSILANTVSFSRPTLYEYISLKEQTAVASHYSIISLVPMLLEIGRSSRVLECGTGSGAMTLFLSERLGSTGLLHTFDIAAHKSQAAKRYFNNWQQSYDLSGVEKWPSNVKFGVKNLCEQSFDKSGLF